MHVWGNSLIAQIFKFKKAQTVSDNIWRVFLEYLPRTILPNKPMDAGPGWFLAVSEIKNAWTVPAGELYHRQVWVSVQPRMGAGGWSSRTAHSPRAELSLGKLCYKCLACYPWGGTLRDTLWRAGHTHTVCALPSPLGSLQRWEQGTELRDRMSLAVMPPGWGTSREVCKGWWLPCRFRYLPVLCNSRLPRFFAQELLDKQHKNGFHGHFLLSACSREEAAQSFRCRFCSSDLCQPLAEAVLSEQAVGEVVFQISLWYWVAPSPHRPALCQFHFLFMVADVSFSHSHWKWLCYALKCNPHSQPC